MVVGSWWLFLLEEVFALMVAGDDVIFMLVDQVIVVVVDWFGLFSGVVGVFSLYGFDVFGV